MKIQYNDSPNRITANRDWDFYTLGGDDVISKDRGGGYISGGDGSDWLNFNYSRYGVNLNVNGGEQFGAPKWSGYAYTGINFTQNWGLAFTFSGIENVHGSSHGDRLFLDNRWDHTVFGSGGDDWIITGSGRDELNGGTGRDTLSAGSGDDRVDGSQGVDLIDGGSGVDQLWGGSEGDVFHFEVNDTGDLFERKADTIHDFQQEDKIRIYSSDPDFEFSVWKSGNDHVVTWETFGEFHDVLVIGDDPHGRVEVFQYDGLI